MLKQHGVFSMLLHKDVPLAKPSRDLVFKFGKGDLDISGSTMNLLMYLSPYVDLEGKINIDLEQAKYDLYMQQSTFERALTELFTLRLLYKSGEHFFSRFHIHTDGRSPEQRYIKLLKAFTSPKVCGYPLRTKRLFYYFVGAKRLGSWHQVRIENLYRNRSHQDDTGVKYFDTCKEVVATLCVLIQDGLIELKLGSSNELLTKDYPNIEGRLFSFFEIEKGVRKSRMHKRDVVNRTISVRIPNELAANEYRVKASEEEIRILMENQHVPFHEIKRANLNYMISYKNELFSMIGPEGIALYRNALHSFIETHSFDLLYYNEHDKLANYFMDYYLLEEIKNVLIQSAYHQKVCGDRIGETTILPLCNEYKLSFEQVGMLLQYFIEKSSIQHKILLEEELVKHEISLNELLYNKPLWQLVDQFVTDEFTNVWSMIFSINETPLMTSQEVREFVRTCAKKGRTVKHETLKDYLNLKGPDGLAAEADAKKVPLYNWLTDRS